MDDGGGEMGATMNPRLDSGSKRGEEHSNGLTCECMWAVSPLLPFIDL